MTKKNTEEVAVTPEVKVAPEETKAPEVKVAPEEAPKKPEAEPAVSKKIKKLADDTDAGRYGTGRERMTLLGADYAEVQAEVNRRYIKRTRS